MLGQCSRPEFWRQLVRASSPQPGDEHLLCCGFPKTPLVPTHLVWICCFPPPLSDPKVVPVEGKGPKTHPVAGSPKIKVSGANF